MVSWLLLLCLVGRAHPRANARVRRPVRPVCRAAHLSSARTIAHRPPCSAVSSSSFRVIACSDRAYCAFATQGGCGYVFKHQAPATRTCEDPNAIHTCLRRPGSYARAGGLASRVSGLSISAVTLRLDRPVFAGTLACRTRARRTLTLARCSVTATITRVALRRSARQAQRTVVAAPYLFRVVLDALRNSTVTSRGGGHKTASRCAASRAPPPPGLRHACSSGREHTSASAHRLTALAQSALITTSAAT